MAATDFSVKSYLGLRYWPTWLALGLLRLIVCLPYAWQLAFGKALGEILFYSLPGKRRIVDINLRACFPEKSSRERRALARASFHSLGMGLIEMGMAWWRKPAWLQSRCRIIGMEHLQAALAQGKGAILLTGHSSALEIGGHLLALYLPMQAMYRKASNKLVNALALRARQPRFVQILHKKQVRDLLRGLQQNLPTWYAPDQDFGRRRSVFVPFMGIMTATVPATAKLAKLSGAPVLLFYPLRLPDAGGYALHISAPLNDFPSGDELLDAERINQALEIQIKAAPEQYMWAHRRFKTRPPGTPPIY